MKITTVVTIDPNGNGNFQGVFPGEAGGWFVTRDLADTMTIDRHDAAGKYRDSCRLINAGHITSAGEVNGTIITTLGGRLVRFKYRPGVDFTKDSVTFIDAKTTGETQISLSPSMAYAVLRERKDGYSYFTRVKTSDLLAGKAKSLSQRVAIKLDPGKRIEQSFGVSETSLFLGLGGVNTRNWLEQWSFLTGKKVGPDYDLTKWAIKDAGTHHEIEFAPHRLIMMKNNIGRNRRLVVGKHDLPADLSQAA